MERNTTRIKKQNITKYEIRFIRAHYPIEIIYVIGVKQRNLYLKYMLYHEEFISIEYRAFYKNGKIGDIIKVL